MIDTDELRRKISSGDIVDHVDIHANVKSLLAELLDRLEAAEKECDAMRAKIEGVERQFPICRVKDIKRVHYMTKVVGLDPDALLYLAPGAHPKLYEIKIALHRALELGKRETWTGAKKYRSREDQCEEQQCWDKVWNLLDAKGE